MLEHSFGHHPERIATYLTSYMIFFLPIYPLTPLVASLHLNASSRHLVSFLFCFVQLKKLATTVLSQVSFCFDFIDFLRRRHLFPPPASCICACVRVAGFSQPLDSFPLPHPAQKPTYWYSYRFTFPLLWLSTYIIPFIYIIMYLLYVSTLCIIIQKHNI